MGNQFVQAYVVPMDDNHQVTISTFSKQMRSPTGAYFDLPTCSQSLGVIFMQKSTFWIMRNINYSTFFQKSNQIKIWLLFP